MTFEEWWDRPEGCGATPDTYKGWEKSCHAAWDASAASRDTEIESMRQQLSAAQARIDELTDALASRDNELEEQAKNLLELSKLASSISFENGAASRDAEVAELRNDVNMMREHILSAHVALSHRRGRSLDVPSGYADDAQSELEQAVSATQG